MINDGTLLFKGKHCFGGRKMTHSEMRTCKMYSTGRVSSSPKICKKNIFQEPLEVELKKAIVPSRELTHKLVSGLCKRNKPRREGSLSSTSSARPTGWQGTLVSSLTTPRSHFESYLPFKAWKSENGLWKMV